MSGLFVIPLSGLKEGHRTYNFEIGEGFFELFEGSEIREGELISFVEIEKRSSHIDLRFRITGHVKISCDRCLEMFMQPIDTENRLLIKLGKNWDENDPDILTIPYDEHELDIKQFLYEFIHLALPLKRIHPDDENGNSGCNPEMLKKINEHKVNSDKEADPRWDELKKLMNNN
jgi:uncharacterized metal-binding protein YceD (DUF177 family)